MIAILNLQRQRALMLCTIFKRARHAIVAKYALNMQLTKDKMSRLAYEQLVTHTTSLPKLFVNFKKTVIYFTN